MHHLLRTKESHVQRSRIKKSVIVEVPITHLIPLTEEEIVQWFNGRATKHPIILEIQKRIFSRALEKVLEVASESDKEDIRKLECIMQRYPVAYRHGGLDHPVFLPERYRQQAYYERVMNDVECRFLCLIGNTEIALKLFGIFKNAIEEGIADVHKQAEPCFERFRQIQNELMVKYGKKERKRMGRWVLSPFEKSLVRSGMLTLEGDYSPKLEFRKIKIPDWERDEVVSLVDLFFNFRRVPISKEQIDRYIEFYLEMKKYLQLVPFFTDKLFEKFGGSFIFIDRDARPLYKGAAYFRRARSSEPSLHLVPVTRSMIPPLYSLACPKGGIPFSLPQAAYKWDDWRVASLNHQESVERELLLSVGIPTIEEATQTDEFKDVALRVYSFLRHIHALDLEHITVIDMGFLGTAARFISDVVKFYSPEKQVDLYLFLSTVVPSFVSEEIPHLGLDPFSYMGYYEYFPKSVPMVETFEMRRGIWVPKYDKLTDEESKWVNGMPGEVCLGVQLAEAALRNLMHVHLAH